MYRLNDKERQTQIMTKPKGVWLCPTELGEVAEAAVEMDGPRLKALPQTFKRPDAFSATSTHKRRGARPLLAVALVACCCMLVGLVSLHVYAEAFTLPVPALSGAVVAVIENLDTDNDIIVNASIADAVIINDGIVSADNADADSENSGTVNVGMANADNVNADNVNEAGANADNLNATIANANNANSGIVVADILNAGAANNNIVSDGGASADFMSDGLPRPVVYAEMATRGHTVRVLADGREYLTESRNQTVAEALHLVGVELGSLDEVSLPLEMTIEAETTVEVSRGEYRYTKEEPQVEAVTPAQKEAVAPPAATPSRPAAPPAIASHGGDSVESGEITVGGETFTYTRRLSVESTAYTWTGNKTATGAWPTVGTIAVDPKVIPLGSRVYVDGYGFAIAADTGGAIKGNIVDVYFDTRDDCIKWGRKRGIAVYILE
jgi:3D (Asp-Asp-Asp) domain-containing protein